MSLHNARGVKVMKQTILRKASLRKRLMCAFILVPAKVLPNAVANIAARKTLNKALKLRNQYVGEILACVRKMNYLEFSADDFGDCYHTASSEPYFYDQSYTCQRHNSLIVIDASGRCVIAQEIGERDPKSERPLKWICTRECKLQTKAFVVARINGEIDKMHEISVIFIYLKNSTGG